VDWKRYAEAVETIVPTTGTLNAINGCATSVLYAGLTGAKESALKLQEIEIRPGLEKIHHRPQPR